MCAEVFRQIFKLNNAIAVEVTILCKLAHNRNMWLKTHQSFIYLLKFHHVLTDHLGCSVDVITLLDKACSGKRLCEYMVDKDLHATKPCPHGIATFVAYLEVSYQCIQGKMINSFAERLMIRRWARDLKALDTLASNREPRRR